MPGKIFRSSFCSLQGYSIVSFYLMKARLKVIRDLDDYAVLSEVESLSAHKKTRVESSQEYSRLF